MTGPEIKTAVSHHGSTVRGQLSCRYSVLGLRWFVQRIWRVWQPIDSDLQLFIAIRLPSSPVRVSVRDFTGTGSRAAFPALTGFEFPRLEDPNQSCGTGDHQSHCRSGYFHLIDLGGHPRDLHYRQSRPPVKLLE